MKQLELFTEQSTTRPEQWTRRLGDHNNISEYQKWKNKQLKIKLKNKRKCQDGKN